LLISSGFGWRFSECSVTDATCRRRSSGSAGHESFAVEHRGHDAPGEQVDGQQRGGKTEREGVDTVITFRDIRAVRRRYSPGDSGMTEIRDRITGPFFALNGIPATIAVPELGAIGVPNIRTVVVLPAPFGPRNPKISPPATLKDTSDTAVRPPKTLVRWLTSMATAGQLHFTTVYSGLMLIVPARRPGCAAGFQAGTAEHGTPVRVIWPDGTQRD
jgi:hypothetical protein